MKPYRLFLLLFSLLPNTWALSWHDVWATKNQQAQAWMNTGQYEKAEGTFDDPAWQAAAAFRAGHFKQAATLYHAFKQQADANYNEGNAWAHQSEWQRAIQAYNRALAIEPAHADALYNRKIVEALLQQEKQKKEEQEKSKQDQDKQDQDKQDQDKQDQDKQDQDKQDQDKQDQDKSKPANKTKANIREERERQHENEQWLRLIPDDPGGLMREKFRRDYLRKQRGWH